MLGLLSGFYRRVDMVLMRFVDGLMAFPGIVLATAAAGYLGPSVPTVILSLSIVLLAPSLRVVRGQVLVVRELQMIEAARATGVPTRRIFSHYILPAVMSPILVQASFIFSAAVLGEAALSFIGVGIGPQRSELGQRADRSAQLHRPGALDRDLPRPRADDHHPGAEPAGRQPARHPRPPTGKEALTCCATSANASC